MEFWVIFPTIIDPTNYTMTQWRQPTTVVLLWLGCYHVIIPNQLLLLLQHVLPNSRYYCHSDSFLFVQSFTTFHIVVDSNGKKRSHFLAHDISSFIHRRFPVTTATTTGTTSRYTGSKLFVQTPTCQSQQQQKQQGDISTHNNNNDKSDTTSVAHVIIVGGGIGGLAIAARIASESATSTAAATTISSSPTTTTTTRITIFEKNAFVGGRCGSYNVTIPSKSISDNNSKENDILVSFRHERGPSLLLLPQIYTELFQDVTRGKQQATTTTTTATTTAANENFGLFIRQCIPAYTIVFDDGDTINVGFPKQQQQQQQQQQQMIDDTRTSTKEQDTLTRSSEHSNGDDNDRTYQLYLESRNKMNSFEIDGAKKWDDYMKLCCAYLECGLPNFIQETIDLATVPNFIQQSILQKFGRHFPLLNHRTVLESIFTSEKMMAVASFQDLYVGLQPFGRSRNNKNDSNNNGGYDPTVAPAVFGLLSAIELHSTSNCLNGNCGVYAPIGGFHTVQQSIYNLLQSKYCPNVTLLCNCTVVHVTDDGGVYYLDNGIDDGRESNSASSQKFLQGDVVVINADLPFAEQSLLLQQEHIPRMSSPTDRHSHDTNGSTDTTKTFTETYDWSNQYRFSSGVIAFHWSLNRSIHELNTHNVFMSVSNRTIAYQSWDHVRNHDTVSTSSIFHNKNEPFNFYIHRPSKTDPTAAPEGMDVLMVLVPCPTIRRNISYGQLPRNEAIERYKREQFPEQFIDRVREAVFHRLSVIATLTNVRDDILHEAVDTPVSYADLYNVGAGTPFGLSHGLHQLSVFRPPSVMNNLVRSDQSKPLSDKVLYCGASTRPGNGVPLVLTGAKLVSKQVLERIRRLQKTVQN